MLLYPPYDFQLFQVLFLLFKRIIVFKSNSLFKLLLIKYRLFVEFFLLLPYGFKELFVDLRFTTQKLIVQFMFIKKNIMCTFFVFPRHQKNYLKHKNFLTQKLFIQQSVKLITITICSSVLKLTIITFCLGFTAQP